MPVYLSYIASHHALGILFSTEGVSAMGLRSCRGHWQQRQLSRPPQRGGDPRAEFFDQPIRLRISSSCSSHFAAFAAFRLTRALKVDFCSVIGP